MISQVKKWGLIDINDIFFEREKLVNCWTNVTKDTGPSMLYVLLIYGNLKTEERVGENIMENIKLYYEIRERDF